MDRAIERLLDDEDATRAASQKLEEVRARYAWPAVVDPLAALIERPLREPGFGSRAVVTLVRTCGPDSMAPFAGEERTGRFGTSPTHCVVPRCLRRLGADAREHPATRRSEHGRPARRPRRLNRPMARRVCARDALPRCRRLWRVLARPRLRAAGADRRSRLTLTAVRELRAHPERGKKIVADAFGLRLLVATAATILLIAISPLFPYSDRVETALRIAAVALFFLVLSGVPTIVLQSRVRLDLAAFVDFITAASTLVLIVVVTEADLGSRG